MVDGPATGTADAEHIDDQGGRTRRPDGGDHRGPPVRGAAPSRAAGASGETGSASSALVLFSDDVETGDLSRWTSSTGLGTDSGDVHGGSWAARAISRSGTIAHPRYGLAARGADCVVPKVRGKKLFAAKKSIRRHHCRVGKIRYRFSSRVAKRRVLAQNPPAHSHRKRVDE